MIRMAKERFVAVVSDDWYQRRRQDDEGEFFRSVADQGPRKGEGGSTRQGIYCFTADGQLLAYKNAGQAPDVMREVLRTALKQWEKLPAFRRKPGATAIPEPQKQDSNYVRMPPENGVILKVYTRILDRNSQGDYVHGSCDIPGADRAARDHLWLTEKEWRGLIPPSPKVGDVWEVPEAVALRIALFHLMDNTRGEPPHWQRDQVRSLKMRLTVEEVNASQAKLRLDGTVLLANKEDPAQATHGYDARLAGFIHWNAQTKAIDRFDMVAVGDHWGEGRYTRGTRPGRKPLGVAFELVRGDAAADRVPPQGARTVRSYFGNSP
jgi:hypothetical protein